MANTAINTKTDWHSTANRPTGILGALALLWVAACGGQVGGEMALETGPLSGTVTFAQWCSGWDLACPTESGAVATEGTPWTVAQWTAASKIANAMLAGDSALSITRADLDDPDLVRAMTALELSAQLQDGLALADESGWQTLSLAPGGVRLDMNAPSQWQAPSGLQTSADTSILFNVDPTAKVRLSGCALSSATAQAPTALGSFEVTDDDLVTIALQGLEVTSVPMEFLQAEALADVDVAGLSSIELTRAKAIPAIGPLLDWWTGTPTRSISLGRDFFAVTREQLPALVPADQTADAESLYPMLEALDRVQVSTAASQRLITATQVAGANLTCDSQGADMAAQLEFASEFGVSGYYVVDADTVGFELFGITVRLDDLFGTTMALSRVELSPDKLTIQDVPLIGSIDIDLTDSSESTMTCTR